MGLDHAEFAIVAEADEAREQLEVGARLTIPSPSGDPFEDHCAPRKDRNRPAAGDVRRRDSGLGEN
jgi:hypothetical protein